MVIGLASGLWLVYGMLRSHDLIWVAVMGGMALVAAVLYAARGTHCELGRGRLRIVESFLNVPIGWSHVPLQDVQDVLLMFRWLTVTTATRALVTQAPVDVVARQLVCGRLQQNLAEAQLGHALHEAPSHRVSAGAFHPLTAVLCVVLALVGGAWWLDHRPQTPPPAPPPSVLTVTSVPPDAVVTIGGIQHITPARFDNLPPGRVVLQLAIADHVRLLRIQLIGERMPHGPCRGP
ncbi:MAG: peptidase associated/transthyretin-like domain-containing protein [Candidatus Xenobia bacterium]